MIARLLLAGLLAGLVTTAGGAIAQEKKKDEARTGKVTGVVTAKDEKSIEVKADGEEKARRYLTNQAEKGSKEVLKTLEVGSRVSLEWRLAEHFRLIKIEVLKKPEPKKDDKQEARGGTVTGVVSAKGDNWIEVKADGEEKARRYVPHWKGGLPKDGGGPDKEMVAEIKKVPLHSRVELKWTFEERPRVEKITILKKGEEKK